MLFGNIVLVLILFKLSSQLVFKGPCPKIDSKAEIFDYSEFGEMFVVPFEIFTPNYMVLPFASNGTVQVYTAFIGNILLVPLKQNDCKTTPGIRFNNRTQNPEV